MNFHTKPNRYVSHVNMKVQDMERSLKFYQDVIGFQILKQEGNKVSLTADGKTSFLTIEQPENVTPNQKELLESITLPYSFLNALTQRI